MSLKQYGGFTLIEVTLFLAISGFLILIVVFGMGPQLKQSEFTDSMQGIGSYINSQYNDIQTGVNNRAATTTCTKLGTGSLNIGSGGSNQAGGNENCVLLGRYFKFSSLGIAASDVVGAVITDSSNPPCSSNDSDLLIKKLKQSCATNVADVKSTANSAQNYTFSWGNALQNGAQGRVPQSGTEFTNTGSYDATNSFGIYRDPGSGQVFTVLYKTDGTALSTSNINAQFCFLGQVSYPGAIYFGGGYKNGEDTVTGSHNLVNVKIDDSSCNSSNWTL